jgi:hypothetical protein
MYKYKVIELVVNMQLNEDAQISTESVKVVTLRKFIGPHYTDTDRINFGLYSSDDLDLFAFFYRDS